MTDTTNAATGSASNTTGVTPGTVTVTAPVVTPPAPPATGDADTVEKWKEHARLWETRAKENAKAKTELEKLQQQTMTETERAIAEAKDAGRQEGRRAVSSQLVDAAVRVAATGRLPETGVAMLLQGLDRSQFLDDDGNVRDDEIKRFVDGIAPAAPTGGPFGGARIPDLGQGTRGSGSATGGDPLLDALTQKLGISHR